MLSLDEEDYVALGYPQDLFGTMLDQQLAGVLKFRAWREKFAHTYEGRAARNKRRRGSLTRKLASAKYAKEYLRRPEVRERRRKKHREYMRKYRATPEGRKKTQEATRRYKQSAKGKAKKALYWKKYYAQRKNKR